MFSADGILGRNFGIMAAGLDGLALRQRVHAENLANVDTPGYQSRTVDFESVLANAREGSFGHGASPLAADGAALPSSIADAATGGGLSGRFAVTTRPGGGPTSELTETSEMMNDNIRFRTLTQQVTNRISALKSVLAEMGRG